jgi:hypothetical protein
VSLDAGLHHVSTTDKILASYAMSVEVLQAQTRAIQQEKRRLDELEQAKRIKMRNEKLRARMALRMQIQRQNEAKMTPKPTLVEPTAETRTPAPVPQPELVTATVIAEATAVPEEPTLRSNSPTPHIPSSGSDVTTSSSPPADTLPEPPESPAAVVEPRTVEKLSPSISWTMRLRQGESRLGSSALS